jgi:hypothetical protein
MSETANSPTCGHNWSQLDNQNRQNINTGGNGEVVSRKSAPPTFFGEFGVLIQTHPLFLSNFGKKVAYFTNHPMNARKHFCFFTGLFAAPPTLDRGLLESDGVFETYERLLAECESLVTS